MRSASIEAIIKTSTRLFMERSFFMSKKSGIVKFVKRNAVAYMFLTPWLLGFFVLRFTRWYTRCGSALRIMTSQSPIRRNGSGLATI